MSIEVIDVNYTYNAGTPLENVVLKNISFTINTGDFIGIIGHTGSGKSTLMQMMNSLIVPTKGKIIVDNIDINTSKENQRNNRKNVGLVFQYPEQQLFEMTVEDDVAFGPKNLGIPKEDINKYVDEALTLVGIDKYIYKKSPFDLSGGQKRKVAIAGVLATKPNILILDEPTAGLDPRSRDDLLGKIKEMHNSLGITIIFVSHSMEDVSRIADKILVLNQGDLFLQGTPLEVFKNEEELEKIGLSIPQISKLIKALRYKGFNINENIFDIKDVATEILKIIKEA
ncbi:MAG: energy-coupling factor transporter ATPase [Lachnospirales bacterium]